MPVAATETPLTFDGTVNLPLAGEARTAASVGVPLSALARRTRALVDALDGHIVWSGRLRSGTPISGTGVFADEIVHIVIGEAFFAPGATYEVPGSLSAVAAWRYVYAYNNAGTLALQHSLDEPDPSLTWKNTGVGTHRYLGCFRTDAAGVPYPFRATRGRYLYRRSEFALLTLPGDLASDGLRALIDSGGASHTLIDLAPALPPHARTALITAEIVATATGANAEATLSLYATDESTSVSQACVAHADVTGNVSSANMPAELEVTADASLSIGYAVSLSSATADYTIDVLGFTE